MLITLDFETYYDREYTLRKMTPVEYILDQRFETIGCAIKEGDAKSEFLTANELQRYLLGIDANTTDVITHNALFDMCILAWRYGFVPRMMIDTLGMSRALLSPYLRSLSLEQVAKFLELPAKGDTVKQVVGMTGQMIRDAGLWDEYATYSCRDADITYEVFKRLMKRGFPKNELFIMDMVLRCAVMPSFRLDTETLYQHLAEVQQAKAALMATITADRSTLMSNDMFAQALKDLGVDPPTKVSLATGKETWAFSKTDVDFNDLQEHPDPRVQALVAARLGIKSTLEETRTQRLIAISQLEWSGMQRRFMPIPLKYSGAHTHRLSGDWKLNMQNLPRGGNLRKALVAPEKKVVVAVDASQIEARLVSWFAGQMDLTEAFANGEDVYSLFASDVYGFQVNKKENPVERFVGKQCLAEDTIILTDTGWKPIQYVGVHDKLWDGTQWVKHKGLIDKGMKPTQSAYGLTATGDHEILTEHGWQAWSEVLTSPSLFQSALSMASLPSQGINATSDQRAGVLGGSLLYAVHAVGSVVSSAATCFLDALRDATHAPRWQQALSVIGYTRTPCLTMSIGQDCSTDWRQQLHGATTKQTVRMSTTDSVALQSMTNGLMTGLRSFGTSKPWKAGITQSLKWIASMLTEVTCRVTSGLSASHSTWQTSGGWQTSNNASANLRRVYDIADAGPLKRFTVMTDLGPVIAHNCILGLGYGLGWKKFMRQLRVLGRNQTGQDIVITEEEARRIVGIYREKYFMIPMMWRVLNAQLPLMTREDHDSPILCVNMRHEHIMGPSGLPIRYHNLRHEEEQWKYDHSGKTKRIYGGAALENIIQYLARIHVMDAAVRVRRAVEAAGHRGIRLALQAHDELVYVVPERQAQYVHDLVLAEMSRRPEWAPNAPLAAEGGIGPTYADAK